MTQYVYEVRSDRPMSAFVGIGNVAVLTFGGYPIIKRDEVHTVSCNGASEGRGTFTVELKERIEP